MCINKLLKLWLLYFQKVLYSYVLPRLVESCLTTDAILVALPALIAMIDHVSKSDYKTHILPLFRRILSSPKPMQVTVSCVVSNVSLVNQFIMAYWVIQMN